jgi:membrane protein YqaA with SNARE-associated domain
LIRSVASRLARPLDRRWRAFGLALLASAVVGAVMIAVASQLAGLVLLGLYCIPSNSVLPIPHEPGLFFFAKFYDPLPVAIAATLGSIVASFADYAVVEAAMRHPRSSRAQASPVFRWAVRWMTRAPFAIVVAFSLIPVLPVSIIRALAPASGYPLGRYIVAQIVGRVPRFWALAWFGRAAMIPTWLLVAITGVTVVLAYLGSRSRPEDRS